MQILFWKVTNKKDKGGLVPIYCRVTINGKRAEFSTTVKVNPSEFDSKLQRIVGKGEIAKVQNAILDDFRHKITVFYYLGLGQGKMPTINELKDFHRRRIQPEEKRIPVYLIEIMELYRVDYFKRYAKIEVDRKHRNYITLISKVIKEVCESNLKISEVDYYLLDQFAHHIVKNMNYKPSYAKKSVAFLKSTMQYAFNKGVIPNFNLTGYKVPLKENRKLEYLEEFEVQKIVKHEFGDTLQKVADAFIVQCNTGLSYIDLKSLRRKHIFRDNEGKSWINLSRQKVESSSCLIPLPDLVLNILKKYEYDIPVLSNTKYNIHLKAIAKEVGIQKKITTHVGRKTYATMLLNKDVPLETVSKLLGHSSIATTEGHYAQVLHMKVARDIANKI